MYIAKARERQSQLKLRTAAWADLEEIDRVYAEAERLTQETGVEHEVDHVIALKAVDENGQHVACGLHVPENLWVIPKSANRSKSNKMLWE